MPSHKACIHPCKGGSHVTPPADAELLLRCQVVGHSCWRTPWLVALSNHRTMAGSPQGSLGEPLDG
jgi:hypothetical protein